MGAITQPARASRKTRSRARCLLNAAPPHALMPRSVTSVAASSAAMRACSTSSGVSAAGASIAATVRPRSDRAASVRMLICASRARSVGKSRSFAPESKPAPERWPAVAAMAARHSPRAMADVPIANHGNTTCSIPSAPFPWSVSRSPRATASFSRLTGALSLPRRPRPVHGAVTVTPFAVRRQR